MTVTGFEPSDRLSPTPNTTPKSWTDDDVQVVSDVLDNDIDCSVWCSGCDSTSAARRVLAALAAAGRLLPADASTEWSFAFPGVVDGRSMTEASARHYATDFGGKAVRRWVGPWVPVPEPTAGPSVGEPCSYCGPGYRIGDEGCRHGAAAVPEAPKETEQ